MATGSKTCLHHRFSDWWTWWETQTEHGYYAFGHFKRFERLLKADQEIIKAAAASELWYDTEEDESNVSFLHVSHLSSSSFLC